MAGIGFRLKQLYLQRNLTGPLRAYLYAISATGGPWLLTVLTLTSIYLIADFFKINNTIDEFRAIILYNFSFAQVFSAPFIMLTTRYLADCIYGKKMAEMISAMMGTLILMHVILFPIVCSFYIFYAKLSWIVTCYAIINFMLIATLYLLSVFTTLLKYYTGVTYALLCSLPLTIILVFMVGEQDFSERALLSFNVGLAVACGILFALLCAEYPKITISLFGIVNCLKRYKMIALGGFVFNAALWVDKWIMWFAPESTRLPCNLVFYPTYESAVFIALLTTIPTMGLFLLYEDINFFDKYLKFYLDIQRSVNYKRIYDNQISIIDTIFSMGKSLVIVQGLITFFCILLASLILKFVGLPFTGIAIFGFVLIASMFQTFIFFVLVLLQYFEEYKGCFTIQLTFLITNLVFTIITLFLGFRFYGSGFALSTLVSFAVGAYILENYLYTLPYHAFITNNESVISRE